MQPLDASPCSWISGNFLSAPPSAPALPELLDEPCAGTRLVKDSLSSGSACPGIRVLQAAMRVLTAQPFIILALSVGPHLH